MLFLRISICITYLSSFHMAHCQTSSISGQIISKPSLKNVEFAHIFIKNGTVGTYSNSHGEFVFHFSDTLVYDTLMVSRIGYEQYNIPISNIDTKDSLIITLKENALNLSEVVIKDDRDSVTAIIKNVLRNIRENYPTKLHYLEGFYRELSLKGIKYTRLIEASVGVTENSYMKADTKSKVKIRQLRKSEDYREYSLKYQLYETAMKKMGEMAWGLEYDNNLFELLNMNYPKKNKERVRKFADKWHFLNRFEFEIIDVFNVDGLVHYKIKFYKPPETSTAFAYYGGEMVINLKDYAIVEWKYGMIAHPYKTFPSQKQYFYEGKYYNQQHILYSKIEGKYYPTYFEKFGPSGGGTVQHIDKKTGMKSLQYDKVTFMVNRVVTSKREFDRIKRRDALDNEIDLYDTDQPYDSVYWASYNILLLDPLLKSTKDDLEKENTLEEQFKKNGE